MVSSPDQLLTAVLHHHKDLYKQAMDAWMRGRATSRMNAIIKLVEFRAKRPKESMSAYAEALWLWI